MERERELLAETRPVVAEQGEAEPVLLTSLNDTRRRSAWDRGRFGRAVTQEHQVFQDLCVELLVLGRCAVEQQERVDEQRQVRDDADVKRAVLLQHVGNDLEIVREIEIESSISGTIGAGAAGSS